MQEVESAQNHASANCNKKKNLEKSQAVLNANLASLLSQVNNDSDMLSRAKLGMSSHRSCADAEIDKASKKHEKCNIISIANSAMSLCL